MYKALYRKWRPMTFDDVISQNHITQTLKNQVKTGKTAHAYLFTGSRGTGKTTCARILAKAVNCGFLNDGSPCLECDICKNADNGSLSDIIEIDAASNNGVDDMRDLRDGTVYTPERCKYKVYIIDEVHMLSPSAFNALLKIMEEPPEYVIFILATTEIHKVPATIVSRCQRYDFRRIKLEDISERLIYIAGQENLKITESAALLIAKLSDGGMRDAISLLDQCSAFSDEITPETVSSAAGVAGRDYLYNIIESVLAEDTFKALDIINQLYEKSKDITRLCDELIIEFRNLMLMKVSDSAENLISCMPDELEKLKNIGNNFKLERIMSIIDILQECREKMSKVLNKRIEFEMGIIKICQNFSDSKTKNIQSDNSELFEKIERLEKQLKEKSFEKDEDIVRKPIKNALIEEPKPNIDIKKVNVDELPLFEQWDRIFEEFKNVSPSVAGSLDDADVRSAGNVLFITAKNRWFIDLFKNKENAMSLGEVIYNVTGKRYLIRARCLVTKTQQMDMAKNLIEKAKNSNIDIAVE